jgi:rare lipoprotein A
MIALIPGITAALACLQPQKETSSSSPLGDFAQALQSAAQSLSPAGPAAPPAPPRYTVQPGDNLTAIAKKLGYEDAGVLARANQLEDPDQLRIGQVLNLPENTPVCRRPVSATIAQAPVKSGAPRSQSAKSASPAQGRGQLVSASWYGSQHHGKLMANGRPFDMYADTVAHKSLPLGTRLNVTNPKTGATVQVQVTDRGPYVAGRSLDLSYGAARKLGVVESGVARVVVNGG